MCACWGGVLSDIQYTIITSRTCWVDMLIIWLWSSDKSQGWIFTFMSWWMWITGKPWETTDRAIYHKDKVKTTMRQREELRTHLLRVRRAKEPTRRWFIRVKPEDSWGTEKEFFFFFFFSSVTGFFKNVW